MGKDKITYKRITISKNQELVKTVEEELLKMIVKTVCGNCKYEWDLKMKSMKTITCPNCKTVYDALIVVNDHENKETMKIVENQNCQRRIGEDENDRR